MWVSVIYGAVGRNYAEINPTDALVTLKVWLARPRQCRFMLTDYLDHHSLRDLLRIWHVFCEVVDSSTLPAHLWHRQGNAQEGPYSCRSY